MQASVLSCALPDLIAVLATSIASVIDARSRRIPNALCLVTACLGLAANALLAAFAPAGTWTLASTLGSALAAGALLLLCFGGLSTLGVLGFGDTKLMAAVGLCVRWPVALRVLPCVLLCGGLVALLYTLARGQLRAVLRNLGEPRALLAERVDEPAPNTLHLFPYATAIALGTSWAVLGRYLPWLAPF